MARNDVKIYVRHGLSLRRAKVPTHVVAVRLVVSLDDRARCIDAAYEATTEAAAGVLAAIARLFVLHGGRL